MGIASWKARSYAKNPTNASKAGVLGCGMMCLGLVSHQWVHSTLSVLLPLFSIGFGYALSEIVFQTLVSVHTPRDLQGSLLGSLSASQACARAAAPVITGYAFDMRPSNLDFAYTVLAIAPLAASMITVLAYVFMPAQE